MEKELIEIEDGRLFIIINELYLNDKIYLLLVNKDNSSDFIIRKKVNDEIVGLDNELEFDGVITKIINNDK